MITSLYNWFKQKPISQFDDIEKITVTVVSKHDHISPPTMAEAKMFKWSPDDELSFLYFEGDNFITGPMSDEKIYLDCKEADKVYEEYMVEYAQYLIDYGNAIMYDYKGFLEELNKG